jgi:hypothetical protein
MPDLSAAVVVTIDDGPSIAPVSTVGVTGATSCQSPPPSSGTSVRRSPAAVIREITYSHRREP